MDKSNISERPAGSEYTFAERPQKWSATNRRSFLAASSAALMATGVFSSRSVAAPRSIQEKLNIACIGTANRAAADIEGVMHEKIVALCDVDRNYLKTKSEAFPDASLYEDYRELIDAEGDKVDAVVIGTTDHHHAPASMRAIKSGKHVYCEKPLTHTVEEARMITQAAADAGVATQLGTQIHAEPNYRRVVEMIQSGAVGEVSDVHVWVGKGWGGGDRPEKGDPVPEHLNWENWLGPAPERPYANGRYHPAQWRRWWDFGQGTLGDMGCHFMDLPFWALNLKYPEHVSASGPEVHPETAPLGMTATYKFPKTDVAPAVTLTWYDGNLTPKKVLGQNVPNSGVMFVGSEGMMFADYTSYRLFPAEKFADYEPPKQTIPASVGHHREWLQACRDGSKALCDFSYSGPLTETVLLGNVAYRSGQAFQWNGESLKADSPDAQQFISKSYRAGWELS